MSTTKLSAGIFDFSDRIWAKLTASEIDQLQAFAKAAETLEAQAAERPRPPAGSSPLFELRPHTGELLVLSPAGLVLCTIGLMEQAELLRMLLGVYIDQARGQQMPQVIHIMPPGAMPPPLAVVRPITDPTA